MTYLHDPLPLPCGQVLPNRMMKAAMSEALSDPGNSPDDRSSASIAVEPGGYGLLVTGNVMVDRTQLGEPGNVVIDDDRDLDALTVGQVGPRRRRTDLGSAQSPGPPIEPAGTGAHSGGPEPGADEPARLANPARTDLPRDR